MKTIEGDFATPKGRFAIVAGRFTVSSSSRWWPVRVTRWCAMA